MQLLLAKFLANALLALKQIIMLYLIAGMGVAAERLRWFPESTARLCTKLLMFAITPCVVLRSFFEMENTPEALRGLAISFACGVLMHVTGIALSEPFFRGRKSPETDSVLHYAAIYGNCGYMALPLAQAMVGSQGVFYCSIVILTFQLFCFTHGEFVMAGGVVRRQKAGEKKQENLPLNPDAPPLPPLWRRLLINAGVLSVAVGLPLFLLRVPVPALLQQPISSVASMNSPLAMIMFGAYLSRTQFSSILRSKKLILATGLKLLAVPAVVMGALLSFGVRGPLLHALLISASAPSANNTVIFAARHGRDAGYAAQVVGLISMLSIVTMPLMIAVGLSM